VQTFHVDYENRLFAGDGHVDNLREMYESRRWDIREELEEWDSERWLATTEADIVEYLLARHAIVCPVLHREQAEQLPVSVDDDGLTRLVMAVPFDGDARVFYIQVHNGLAWHELPQAQVEKGELRLTWVGSTRGDVDPAPMLREFGLRLDMVERQLSTLRPDIAEANINLSDWVTTEIASARERLLRDRKLEAGLGVPVRRRADAGQFEVPVTRRKISTPRRPARTDRFEPEPFLSEEQYEQALAVLRNARNALERSPSMTAHLGEEMIRDLLLFFLNGQFEGAAAGEVFNAHGKTDILIRAGDRNVFIAECKIWKGPKVVRDALGQLLNYLTWRDTKAALLLFIRTGEPTTIINKSIAEIKGHANCKSHDNAEDGERYDFILHANGDPNREIRLAFLPFALQDTPGQQ
jgi:hypothetical protein